MIIGANISKNKYTDNYDAHKDCIVCLNDFHDNFNYFTLNVSSPNTPLLRDLLDFDPLSRFLESIQNENQKRSNPKPLYLKISPELSSDKLENIVDLCLQNNIQGIVSTNTTTNHNFFKGGISGEPLVSKSGEFIKQIKSQTNDLTIISSGGIMSKEIAKERLNSGADLIQLYTGLIFEGPFLPKKILKTLEIY
jgi:dihydroorotate dehydrogenase